MKKEHGEKLKGLVSWNQIGAHCILVKFDEDKVQEWVDQLTKTDKRVEGCKDFEW